MTEAHEKQEPLQILHRDLSTRAQIDSLLSVAQTMMQFISREPEERENIPGSRAIPGESWIAAENTLMKACERLDSIIEEPQRWGIKYQQVLESLFQRSIKVQQQWAEAQTKHLEAERERAEAQKEAALEIQSPHFRYKPSLTQLTDGNWAAFLGDGGEIAGYGESPAAALRAFDLTFNGGLGQLTENQKQVAAQREIQLEKDEDNTLEQSGVKPSEETKGGGKDPNPNSGSPES